MSQKKIAPDNAESVPLHRYWVITQKPSKIVPSGTQESITGVRCPRCGTVSEPVIDHLEYRVCASCGLNMQVIGNSLYIWLCEQG